MRQFHVQINNAYPSYKEFFHEIECPTSLAFYERYPSPQKLEKVSISKLAEFLRSVSNNTCSTNRSKRILDLVKKDEVRVREYQYARDGIVQSMARNIRYNIEEMGRIEKEEGRLLKELGYRLETIPGFDTVTASALVAHIGDISRFSSSDRLATFAGVAPVYRGSGGKGRNYQNNNTGNRKLYAVLYLLAMQQIHVDSKKRFRNKEMRGYYEKKVSEGKTKVQALICVMRKMVRIVYSMMKNRSEYRFIET